MRNGDSLPVNVSASNRPASREAVAAVLVLRDDGAALLQHRDDKPGLRKAGMWVPPGGHCDPGESFEVCARRELCEETEYRCDSLHFLVSIEDNQDAGWPPYHLVVFWTRYDGVQAVRCHEGQALEFVERRRAASYAIPEYLVAAWDAALTALGNLPSNRLSSHSVAGGNDYDHH